jgi:hypothetical protein
MHGVHKVNLCMQLDLVRSFLVVLEERSLNQAAGVAVVPLSDAYATWDILVVWQRARIPAALKTLLAAFPSR